MHELRKISYVISELILFLKIRFGECALQDKHLNKEVLQNQSGLLLCRQKMAVTLLIHSGDCLVCVYSYVCVTSYVYSYSYTECKLICSI